MKAKSWCLVISSILTYIDINTNLKKQASNNFEKDFFKLTNNAVFEKTVENVKKHKDIKLVTTEKNIYLVSDPNYPTTKFYTENLLAIEMKKKEIILSKPVHWGLSILELSKTLM